MTRFTVAAIAVAVVLILSAGCGENGTATSSLSAQGVATSQPTSAPTSGPLPSAAPDSASPVAFAPASPPSPTSTPADSREAANRIAEQEREKIDPSNLLTVDVSPSPAGARQGPWFYATVSCPSTTEGQCMLPVWEADLAQGSTAERMNWSGVPDLANVIVGSSITAQLADGSTVGMGGDQGDIQAGQDFADTGESDSQIEAHVRSAVASAGLTVVNLKVLHDLGAAVQVTVQMPSNGMPAGVTAGSLAQSILGNPFGLDGLYLQVDDAAGQAVVRTADAYRSGATHLWFADGYDALTGSGHG